MNSGMRASKSLCRATHLKMPVNAAATTASPDVTMSPGKQVFSHWTQRWKSGTMCVIETLYSGLPPTTRKAI